MTTEEARKKNEMCVYKLTFPDGKCCVGKAKNLSSRIRIYKRNVNDESNSPVMVAVESLVLRI